MNSRERIMASIAGEAHDHTALWPFVMAFSAKYAGISYREFATDYRKLAQAQIKTAEAFDLDVVTVDSDAYREASAFGARLEFPEDDLPVQLQVAIPDKTAFCMKAPDIGACPRLIDKIEGVRYLHEYYRGEKAVCGWVEAPLQSTGVLFHMDDFMIDLFEEDEFILELLDLVTEFEIAFAVEQAKAGADLIGIGDAMASLVSADVYRELIMPHIRRMVDSLHEKTDAKLKYHICGNAKHILPFVEEIGFDVVNVDYKIDMQEAFELTHHTTAIKGNLNPVAVLKDGSLQDIERECEKLLALHNPRFILSAGCEVPRDTPVDHFQLMCNMVKNA